MHTPAAADSDVAPIWADVDVHRGPGRRGRGAPGAAPWAPTPHDAAGGMAPVLGALGAQIVMAEALGAPALNVGAARSLGWRARGPRPKRDSSPLAGRVPALASSRARQSAFGLNSQLPSPDTDPWPCAPGACGARGGHAIADGAGVSRQWQWPCGKSPGSHRGLLGWPRARRWLVAIAAAGANRRPPMAMHMGLPASNRAGTGTGLMSACWVRSAWRLVSSLHRTCL
jgi:hypothetical protein